MTTKSTITTNRPAELTAAAVSSPEIAEAILKPERTSMIMNRTIMPRGVLIMLRIVPPEAPFFGMFTYTSPKTAGDKREPQI